jgi:hypothetical protein
MTTSLINGIDARNLDYLKAIFMKDTEAGSGYPILFMGNSILELDGYTKSCKNGGYQITFKGLWALFLYKKEHPNG